MEELRSWLNEASSEELYRDRFGLPLDTVPGRGHCRRQF